MADNKRRGITRLLRVMRVISGFLSGDYLVLMRDQFAQVFDALPRPVVLLGNRRL
jgi:hypothetical protein